MVNIIGCLIVLILGLLIGNIESISIRETKILTLICWVIALYFARGDFQHYD